MPFRKKGAAGEMLFEKKIYNSGDIILRLNQSGENI